MLFPLSLSHWASSSRNLFVCRLKIFLTADEINLLIRIAVALSNGSGRPPSSSKTLLSPSRLLMKLQIWVPSRGFNSVILDLILSHMESTFSLKWKWNVFFIAEFERAAKVRNIAVYRFLRTTVPFVTAHLEIFHCTHHPVIPKSDLYFTFCSNLNALSKRISK